MQVARQPTELQRFPNRRQLINSLLGFVDDKEAVSSKDSLLNLVKRFITYAAAWGTTIFGSKQVSPG